MKSRFLYMKLLGLLLVIVGFSYSITSFYNFFEYIFGYKIFNENLNFFLMVIGLVIPVYIFVYGIYFYFYTDYNIVKINKFLLINNIVLVIIGILISITKIFNVPCKQIFEFNHISFSYCLILLASLGIFGCYKFKF